MMLHDVTQQVRNEKALQEQKEALSRFSRLASLGEVAAGISHEINTPLNAISTKTELLRRMVDGGRSDPERTHRLTQDIDRMVENISQVITGLKSISRSAGRDQRERVFLRKLLEDTLRIVGFSTRRRGVKIHLDLQTEDIQAWCNPVQICQILINLTNNALDAVGDQPDAWVRLTVAEHGDAIVVDVVDSGSGVQPEVAEKIMTPFFTTKGPEKGTGLSLSRSIARRHGGDLELCRDTDHTTFRWTLPKRMAEDAE
jgi:two-component system CheB/CheR fusion protein